MSVNVNLSNLHVDKIPEASRVLAKCWRYAYNGLINDEYLTSLSDDHWVEFLKNIKDTTTACILAENDNQIIGVAVFGDSITERYLDDGEIICLYVLPEFIGKNVGHLLFEYAENSLKEQGYQECTICTFKANTKAIKFYEKHDYVVVSDDETVEIGTQNVPYVILRKAL